MRGTSTLEQDGPSEQRFKQSITTPILGKNISKSLLKKIVTSKVKEIYIALDRDSLKKAVECLRVALQVYPGRTNS